MCKQKVMSEKDLLYMVLPGENDVLVVQKMLGFDRVMAKCQDGNIRTRVMSGKMKHRTWIREGGIVPVSLRGFQSEERGEIFWHLTRNHIDEAKQKGVLKIE